MTSTNRGESRGDGCVREEGISVVMRGVPATYAQALQDFSEHADIDVALARAQHSAYADLLRANDAVANVYSIEADDEYPDCMFIEDTCVVSHGVCVITAPGAPTRQGEVAAVRRFFSDDASPGKALVCAVHDMGSAEHAHDEGEGETQCRCEGGDVMTTDTHMFVGISSRTNEAGFRFLKRVFEEATPLAVHPVYLPESGCLHLKSIITWAGDDIGFIAAQGDSGEHVWEQVRKHTGQPADCVTFVETLSLANVLRVGNTLYHTEAGSDGLLHQLCVSHGVEAALITNSEAQKADGAITCCSLIIH